MIGNCYVFNIPVDATIEWVVVRYHPDDSNLVLIVPIDDFPFVGGSDVKLREPWVARCGASTWLHYKVFEEQLRTKQLTTIELSSIRDKLSKLARGQVTTNKVDCDPDYLAWMNSVMTATQWVTA